MHRSARGATLDTGGWLALTRPGLSPGKKRQASLGALRRRDAGYPAPPAQSRTCGFPASGSSVVLAFARTFTVARYKAQLLLPAVRLARVYPILHVRHEFPVWAAYSRRVLRPVAGFPDLRLLCPIRHLEGIRRSPACLATPCPTIPPERTPCQGSSPVRVPAQPVSSSCFLQEPSGLPEFSNVSLPACHGLRTPADLHTQAITGASYCLPGR